MLSAELLMPQKLRGTRRSGKRLNRKSCSLQGIKLSPLQTVLKEQVGGTQKMEIIRMTLGEDMLCRVAGTQPHRVASPCHRTSLLGLC